MCVVKHMLRAVLPASCCMPFHHVFVVQRSATAPQRVLKCTDLAQRYCIRLYMSSLGKACIDMQLLALLYNSASCYKCCVCFLFAHMVAELFMHIHFAWMHEFAWIKHVQNVVSAAAPPASSIHRCQQGFPPCWPSTLVRRDQRCHTYFVEAACHVSSAVFMG